MNIFIRIFVLLIVLSSLSQNQAQAGFFDWLGSKKEVKGPVLKPMQEDPVSFDHFYSFESPYEDSREDDSNYTVVTTHTVRATGYSSTPDQTDSTPFITAKGTYVRDGIIAANFNLGGRRVPFGTLVRIPEIYGDKVFVVEDRMNARYTNNIDIWFPERELAKAFGSKKVTIEIVTES